MTFAEQRQLRPIFNKTNCPPHDWEEKGNYFICKDCGKNVKIEDKVFCPYQPFRPNHYKHFYNKPDLKYPFRRDDWDYDDVGPILFRRGVSGS
jgi:acetone carboxylase gamma subunit